MFSFIIRATEGHCKKECISVTRFLYSETPYELFSNCYSTYLIHLLNHSKPRLCAAGSKWMYEMQSLFRGNRNKLLQRNDYLCLGQTAS